MNLVVCLKQILDPEIPARDFRVDQVKREAERGGATLVTNIFCENALETALQFRERIGSGEITVLSFGPATAEDSLRKALAMKADSVALVLNDGHPHPDPLTVARVLAAASARNGCGSAVPTKTAAVAQVSAPTISARVQPAPTNPARISRYESGVTRRSTTVPCSFMMNSDDEVLRKLLLMRPSITRPGTRNRL